MNATATRLGNAQQVARSTDLGRDGLGRPCRLSDAFPSVIPGHVQFDVLDEAGISVAYLIVTDDGKTRLIPRA